MYDDVDEFSGEKLAERCRQVTSNPPAVLRILPFGWQQSTSTDRKAEYDDDAVKILREPLYQQDLVEVLDKLLSDAMIFGGKGV